MALTKTTEIDKIEIVTEYKHIQVREATIIKEDGVELSRNFHRKVLSSDMDVSSEPQDCLLYTSPSPRDRTRSRMPSSA